MSSIVRNRILWSYIFFLLFMIGMHPAFSTIESAITQSDINPSGIYEDNVQIISEESQMPKPEYNNTLKDDSNNLYAYATNVNDRRLLFESYNKTNIHKTFTSTEIESIFLDISQTDQSAKVDLDARK